MTTLPQAPDSGKATRADVIAAPLTRQDVLAIRQADRIVLLHSPAETGSRCHGQGTVRCIKKLSAPGPFDEDEKRYEIQTESGVTDFGRRSPDGYNCSQVDSWASHFCNPWRTVGAWIKPGDCLAIHWTGANDCQLLKDAGLHTDQVEVRITRANRKGDRSKTYAFIIGHATGPDNCVRMVRSA